MHGSLLATATGAAEEVPRLEAVGSVAPNSRSCLDHADQGIRAARRSRRRACSPDDDPASSPQRGDMVLTVPRHSRPPANPPARVPARQCGWLGSPSAAGQRLLPWNRPAPAAVAAQRFDHRPITDRSRGRRLVHPSITHHSAGADRERRESERPHRAAGLPRLASSAPGREPHVARRPPPRSAASRTCEPGENTQRQTVPQHRLARRSPSIPAAAVDPSGQGRSPSRASSPTGHLRPTPSSARIRLTDHPCSTCRASR